MDYKILIISWILFAVAIVYWDIHRWKDDIPVSDCHNAQIRIYHDRPMCTECKKFCEIKNKRKESNENR